LNNRDTFKKPERISKKKEICRLFLEGDSLVAHPLRVVYLKHDPSSGATISVLISVPKKNIKHAVDRNRIKRLIREAYRLNKASLIRHCQEKECGLLVSFIFIENKNCRWNEIEAALKEVLGVLELRTN